MTQKDTEQTDERDLGTGPWWTEFGTWGAVALIVAGGLAAAWMFLRLPGTPENLENAFYGPAKIIAIGLVITGSAVLGRLRRVSPTPPGEALPEAEVPDSKGE